MAERNSAPEVIEEIILLPLDVLDNHPENVLYGADDPGLEGLAASIAECGVLQPLIVQPKGEGRYEVIAGHRRKRASQMAGLKKVPCVVKPENVHDVLSLIVTNHFTRESSPMTKARAIRKMKELLGIKRGGNKKARANGQNVRLTDWLNESERNISRYDKLNDLIPALQNCVDNGSLGITIGAQLAFLPPAIQEELYEVLGGEIGKIGTEDVKRLRDQNDRGYFVLEVMQKKLDEMESELAQRRKMEGDIADLENRIRILRSKKRSLEYDIIDRENAAKVIWERSRKNGAALVSLLEKVARPVAGAKPQIENLLDNIDSATATHLIKWGQVLREVGELVERTANESIRASQKNDKS